MAIFDSYVSLPEGQRVFQAYAMTSPPTPDAVRRAEHPTTLPLQRPHKPPRRRRRAPQRLLRASLKRRVKENIVTTMLAYDVHWLPCVFSFEWFEMVIFQWCIKIFTFDWNWDLIDTNTCMESRPFVIWSCSLEKLSFSCRCVNPRVNGKRKQENEDSKGVGWTCEHPKKIHSLLAKKTFHGQQKRLLHLHLQKVKINIYMGMGQNQLPYFGE